MPFVQQPNVIITDFRDISINLFVPRIISEDNPQTGEIEIQLTLSNGEIKVVGYDLLARLADDAAGLVHRNNLLAMRDYILARIPAEVLP